MQDLQQLERSVQATLAEARRRPGVGRRVRPRPIEGRPGTAVDPWWHLSLAEVLRMQRQRCAALRRDIEAARAHRRRLEAELDRQARRRLEVEQHLEVLDVRTELARRRRRRLEPSIEAAQRQVEQAREHRRRLTRSVLQTHDALRRLTGSLPRRAGPGERR